MEIFQVDAFTQKPFAGNPAAVVLLKGPGEEGWMQQMAAEMNLSETAFVCPQGEGFSLRWFTPLVEVDLCGHATLASAHILWERGMVPGGGEVYFFTKSGRLSARRREGGLIWLNFPAQPLRETPPPPDMLKALGVSPLYCGRNDANYLLEVESEEMVRRAAPDFNRLKKAHPGGVIVTSPGKPPYDFVSRFFDPGEGIDEDPVTGSAHCCLGPFWQKRLRKNEFTAFQASRRGGELRLQLEGDRVHIGGYAVTVLKGELLPETGAG